MSCTCPFGNKIVTHSLSNPYKKQNKPLRDSIFKHCSCLKSTYDFTFLKNL